MNNTNDASRPDDRPDHLDDIQVNEKTPIRVERIDDFHLGEAIANRYGLHAPLSGERLLDFFDHLVKAHDAYHEALKDPMIVLKVLHREPDTPDAYLKARDALTSLLREYRSLILVLGDSEKTFDEFIRIMSMDSDDSWFMSVTYEQWMDIERFIRTTDGVGARTLEKKLGVPHSAAQRLSYIYGVTDNPDYAGSKQGKKLTEEQREVFDEMIRGGLSGTLVVHLMREKFNVMLSRSSVTKRRRKLDEMGLL